jgi:hypothetical protein
MKVTDDFRHFELGEPRSKKTARLNASSATYQKQLMTIRR